MKPFPTLLLVALVQLSFVGMSTAQAPPNPRAVELNESGVEAFQAGRFSEAARNFQQAYDLDRNPANRKNEAIAWFKANDCQQAVGAANKFLLLDQTLPGDRTEIQTIVANCKVEFARDAVEAGDAALAEKLLVEAETLKPDAHVTDQIAMVRVEIAELRKRDKKKDTVVAKEGPGPIEPAPEPRPRILEYSLIGTGAALVLGGVVYHAVALGWQTDFLAMTGTGGDPEQFDSLRNRVHTARIVVPIMYTLGALAAASGVGLLVAYEPMGASATAHNSGRVWLGFATQF